MVVVSMNILSINALANPDTPFYSRRLAALGDILTGVAPDMVLLQELDWPAEQATALAAKMTKGANKPYTAFVAPLIAINGWKESLAIITHWPVTTHEMLEFPGEEIFCHRIDADIDGFSLLVSNCHLDPYDADKRARQISMIADWMLPYPLAIAGGDYNTSPEEPGLDSLKEHFQSAYVSVHGREPDQTIPTPLRPDIPPKVIDYIWHSSQILVRGAKVCDLRVSGRDDLYVSDHYGLLATMSSGN